MSNKRVFYVMIAAIVLTTGIATASVVLGSSMLKKKSLELTELKIQDRLIEEQQIALVQANKDIEKYEDLETISKSIVPQDKDQAITVREIIKLADASKIKISTISFPTSTLGQKAPPVAPSADGTTPKVQAPPISQVKPVDGIQGLFQLEVTIQVNEIAPTYNQLIEFLGKLEQNRRTAQVTSISIDPSATNRNLVEFNLTMNVFVKP
ncbi:hypothetical protein H0X10_02515 [Candidatus Saccharibacteria bacterium]|nr:hypothetical protein [Candidatus Saccharibacteria bacterium]